MILLASFEYNITYFAKVFKPFHAVYGFSSTAVFYRQIECSICRAMAAMAIMIMMIDFFKTICYNEQESLKNRGKDR